MSFDVFISYSWSDPVIKVFAHDLAVHLDLAGFNVGFDENVDYGDELSGFMNELQDAKHVLMIADEYVSVKTTV